MSSRPTHSTRAALAGMPAVLLAVLLALGAGIGCNDAPAARAGDHDEPAGHDEHDVHDEHDEHDEHAGHDHEGPSDLDRPVEELLAQHCEHEMQAFRCDECRYEVGIARVPADLLAGGLVRVGRPVRTPLASEIDLGGVVEFDRRKVVELGARAGGIVRRVGVDFGDEVAAGGLLVEIESAELGQAQADHLEALAVVRLTARTRERQRELRAAGITSEREHLEAEQAHEAAGIRADLARQTLARFGLTAEEIAALEQAGAPGADGRLAVRAPFAGEVIDITTFAGGQVAAGDPLLRLADRRTLWLWVDLYEPQIALLGAGTIGPGLPARVTVRAYPDRGFAGRLDHISRVMDAESRTIKARITLENPGGELRPGMFASCRVASGPPEEALALPSAAVLTDEERDFVFVHCIEDFYVRRPVTRGRSTGELVEVRGLPEDRQVVLGGAFLLKSDVLRAKMGEGCAH